MGSSQKYNWTVKKGREEMSILTCMALIAENHDESDVLSRISAEDRCHMGKMAWQDLPKRRDNLTHRVNDGHSWV